MQRNRNGGNFGRYCYYRVGRRPTELFVRDTDEPPRYRQIEERIVPAVPGIRSAAPGQNEVVEMREQIPQQSKAVLILSLFLTVATVMVILYKYLRKLENKGIIPYPTFMVPLLFVCFTTVHVYISIIFFQSNMRKTVKVYMVLLIFCLASHLKFLDIRAESSAKFVQPSCFGRYQHLLIHLYQCTAEAEPIEIDENGERV